MRGNSGRISHNKKANKVIRYDDINAHVNEWTGFAAFYCDEETEEGLKELEANKAELEQKLARLKELIEEKEYSFGEGYGFL